MKKPLQVFCCYAHEDQRYLHKLKKHLMSLQREQLIEIKADINIRPGTEWEQEISHRLNEANIILLLISADFIASDYCFEKEMQQAITRHEHKKACVIPVIIRPTSWEHMPFGKLQSLPKGAKPVSEWRIEDKAWLDVTNGIREILNNGKLSPADHSSTRCDFYTHITSMPHNYVERTEVLTSVRNALLSTTSAIVLTSQTKARPEALQGMGGIGKTVIARALCDDPEVRAAFPDGILGATLGLHPGLVPKLREWINVLGGVIIESAPTLDSLRNMLAKLLSDRACLLILDDVWQRSDAEAFLVGGVHCRVLLTTRNADIAYELGAKQHPISLMTESDAILLLEGWPDGQLTGTDLDLKRKIVKRLGYLPLAVNLAGAQLQHNKSPDKWLRAFKIQKLKSHRPETLHDNLVDTFELSVEDLNEQARQLYVALAIFKNDEATPLTGIEQLWQGLHNLDTEATEDLLNDLKARALLELIPHRSVRLHSLLHELINTKLGNQYEMTHQVLINVYSATQKVIGWHTANDDGYLYNHLAYHMEKAGLINELKELFTNQNWLQARVPQCNYTYDGYLEDLTLAWKSTQFEALNQIKADQEPLALVDCVNFLLINSSINSIAEKYVPEIIVRAVEVGLWTPDRALSVATRMPYPDDYLKTCVSLLDIDNLSEDQKYEIRYQSLQTILNLASEEIRTYMLGILGPQLKGDLLRQALEAAFAIRDEENQASVLSALAPKLTEELAERAFDHILNLEDVKMQAQALIPLAPRLTREVRASVLEWLLDTSLALKFEGYGAEILPTLAPYLEGVLLEKAIEGALDIKKADALINLSPQLKPDLAEKALKVVLGLKDDIGRTKMLTSLVPRLMGEARRSAEKQLLEVILDLEIDMYRVDMLSISAPQLEGPLLERALEIAIGLKREHSQAEALIALAPKLTEELAEKAFDHILTLNDAVAKAQVAAALMSQLTAKQQTQICTQMLNSLMDEDETVQASVLIALAPRLQEILVKQALDIAITLDFETSQADVLVALAPQLTGELVDRALDAALALEDAKNRVLVLAALAPQLTGELVNRVLNAALALEDAGDRVLVLAALAPQLTEKLVSQALDVALITKDREDQVKVIVALVPALTDELRKEVLERILETIKILKFEDTQVEALVDLAPYLTGKLREQAREIFSYLKNESAQAQVLAAWLPQLKDKRRLVAIEQILDIAITSEFEGIQARLLIALAPYLTKEQVELALKISLNMTYEGTQAQVIAALAPQLPEELVEQVLEVAFSLKNEEAQTQVLISLASQVMREEALKRILKHATTLKNENQIQVLVALIPQLKDKQRSEVLEQVQSMALTLRDEKYQFQILASIMHHLSGEKLKDAFEFFQNEAQKVNNRWVCATSFAEILPLAIDNPSTLRLTRIKALEALYSLKYHNRQEVFKYFLFYIKVFSSPVISSGILGAIVSRIVEVCEEWDWL